MAVPEAGDSPWALPTKPAHRLGLRSDPPPHPNPRPGVDSVPLVPTAWSLGEGAVQGNLFCGAHLDGHTHKPKVIGAARRDKTWLSSAYSW